VQRRWLPALEAQIQRRLIPLKRPGRADVRMPRMQWLPFEQLDVLRQAQGRMLDALGFGPLETPYVDVHHEAGVRLRRYSRSSNDGPPVLIVPAPIKGPYIWDLAPEVSAVRRCLAANAQVYMIQWQPAPAHFGFPEFAERLILACLDAMGAERALLLAHSLGGLLASIFATLHPKRVQGLILLTAPLHFGPETSVFNAMAGQVDVGALPDALPGSFLSAASMNAAPSVFGSERVLDAILSSRDPADLLNHMRVERWMLDEFALPRRFVTELVTELIWEDRFVRGTFDVKGRAARPSRLSAPLLCVLDSRCPLVPPAAVLPFVQSTASREKTLLYYGGDIGVALQHVGPLVGRHAHRLLWPQIVAWMAKTWTSASML